MIEAHQNLVGFFIFPHLCVGLLSSPPEGWARTSDPLINPARTGLGLRLWKVLFAPKSKLPTRFACGNAPTGSGARLLSKASVTLD